MKENEKILILKTLLKVTFIMIFISVGLKLLGLNIFEADRNNKILLNISTFIEKNNLKNIIDCLLLLVQNFIVFRLCCKNKNIKVYYVAAIIATLITLLSQFLLFGIGEAKNTSLAGLLYYICTFLILIVFPIIIDIRIKYNIKHKSKIKNILNSIITRIKRPLFILLIITIYQITVMFLREITYIQFYESIYNFLLNFDYTILLLSTYYLFLKKETNIELKSSPLFSVNKFLNKKISFEEIKNMVVSFQEFRKKFKESNKTDKIIVIIYLFFTILSELINLGIVIFVAYLNHAIIESFFIITSFLISRKVFGAFHLDSAIKCWLVSNVSFFILSKLTINVGITYVVPILCGISLAYITSKFIKDKNKELYKGIRENDLLDICENKKLTKIELEILKKYYCEGLNIDKLTFTYHYSRAQLYRYKSNAEKKIMA